MYGNKIIAHNLKATKEQIIDDLNGIMSPLQRKMMRTLLKHLDELNSHIHELDDDIDSFMKPEEKQASAAIQDVTGIGNTSAQAVISVIGTDMGRFPDDAHIASWAGLCPGDNESAGKRKSGKTRKGNALLRETLVNCAHAAVKKQEILFLRTVYEDKCAPWKETCICGCCTFHVGRNIPYPEGWCGFQGFRS